MCNAPALVMGGSAVLGFLGEKKAARAESRASQQAAQNNLISARRDAGFMNQHAQMLGMFAHAQLSQAHQLAGATRKIGRAQEKAFDKKGEEALALSTRNAYHIQKETDGMVSDGIAAIVASGGVTEDAIPVIAKVATQGQYNKDVEIFNGFSAREDYRFQGDMAKAQSDLDAAFMVADAQMQFFNTQIEIAGIRHNAHAIVDDAQRGLTSTMSNSKAIQSARNLSATANLFAGGAQAYSYFKKNRPTTDPATDFSFRVN